MNLNHIHYFVVTGKLGSITRAAEALNVSRSAISDAIRHLEDELMSPLFRRVGRNLILTEMGAAFLVRGELILDEMFNLKQEMLSYSNQRHILKMGCAAISGTVIFPYLFSCKSHFMDSVELQLDCDDVELLLAQVSREKLDFCLVEEPTSQAPSHQKLLLQTKWPDLLFQKILTSRMVLCVSHQHPFAARSCVDFSEVLDQPLILFKDGYQSRSIRNEFQRRGKQPNIVFTSNQVYTVSTLIRLNHGISFMDVCIASNLSNITTVALKQDFSYDIWVAWKNRPYAKHIKQFIQFLTTLDYNCHHSNLDGLLPDKDK